MFSLKKFLLIFIALLSSLLLFELYFQIVEKTNLWKIFPVVRPVIGQPDKEMGYRFTPNTESIWIKENRNKVIINSYGINDYELKDSRYRVVLTGNSMIESLQVPKENNFENITEKKLNKKYDNFEILNLAMSGHGPLRQLIMLESYGFSLDPNIVIMFIPFNEFLFDEINDDSIHPGYVFNKNGKIERGYSYKDRYQVKYSENYLFKKILYLIQEVSTLRMFYFLSKKDLNKLLGLKNYKSISMNNDNKKDNCKSSYIKNHENLWLNNQPNKKNIIAKYFFKDLSNSVNNKNFKLLVVIEGFPIQENCNQYSIIRDKIINKIISNFHKDKIKFVDIDKILYEKIKLKFPNSGYLKIRKKMSGFGKNIGDGHLNLFGHLIYSEVLEDIIESSIN